MPIITNFYNQCINLIQHPLPSVSGVKDGKPFELPCPPQVQILDEKIEIYPFTKKGFLSDSLTSARVRNFKSDEPIFIDSQTGTGKTSWIFKTLYPVICERGQHLLILSNRYALKQQTKYDAIEAAGTTQKEELTDLGISKEHVFGNIKVYSYQDFEHGNNRKQLLEDLSQPDYYGAIVFDECHFFISDADFNPYTENIFQFLIGLAVKSHVLRIYLTGTPYYVFNKIFIEEQKQRYLLQPDNYLFNTLQPKLKLYHYPRDYSYLNVYFFNQDKLLDIINSSNEKWLIFTDSIPKGNQLMKKLVNKSSYMFTAETKNSEDSTATTVREELEKNNTFPVDILIATKCLDVGITIRTKNLNIVCFFYEKVDFLQAIGRKRVFGNESTSLYIPEYSRKDIEHWISMTKNKMNEMQEACNIFKDGQNAYGRDFPDSIYIDNGKYRHNEFAFIKLKSQLSDWNSLVAKISSFSESETTVIKRHFLSWMEHTANCFEDYPDINTSFQKNDPSFLQVKDIVSKHEAQTMNKEDFDTFLSELSPYDTRKDQRKSRTAIKTRTANSIFRHYGLNCKMQVKGSGEKAVYKIIPDVQKEEATDE